MFAFHCSSASSRARTSSSYFVTEDYFPQHQPKDPNALSIVTVSVSTIESSERSPSSDDYSASRGFPITSMPTLVSLTPYACDCEVNLSCTAICYEHTPPPFVDRFSQPLCGRLVKLPTFPYWSGWTAISSDR